MATKTINSDHVLSLCRVVHYWVCAGRWLCLMVWCHISLPLDLQCSTTGVNIHTLIFPSRIWQQLFLEFFVTAGFTFLESDQKDTCWGYCESCRSWASSSKIVLCPRCRTVAWLDVLGGDDEACCHGDATWGCSVPLYSQSWYTGRLLTATLRDS